jgi:hypothetical protein
VSEQATRARTLVTTATLAVFACSGQPSGNPEAVLAAPSEQAESVAARAGEDGPLEPIRSRILPPPGFRRLAAEPGSFGAWLREIELRPGRPPVRLHDGSEKENQAAHHAVLDVDVGEKDLQQCADAVIRLRAEYLFSGPCREEIRFDFTSGDRAGWVEWRDGARPTVRGNRVSWKRAAAADESYSNFRAYLDTVFLYAGSASLEREMVPASDPSRIEMGDVFIQGGFPGHAVLVIDVAENADGERAFLLAQSFMPAQEIHILRSSEEIDPWYRAKAGGLLRTPEWDFQHGDLKRFSSVNCRR